MKCVFHLYVSDNQRSAQFYSEAFEITPLLHDGGIQFQLPGGCSFGLLTEKSAKARFGTLIDDPEMSNGISRIEMAVSIADPSACIERAITAGAKMISPLQLRDNGDESAYVLDPDGHVLVISGAKASEA